MDTPTYIGNFCYDPAIDALTDVRKVEVTPELIERVERQFYFAINCPRYDQADPPMSDRIAWRAGNYTVFAGSWAEPFRDRLTQLLRAEFGLPTYLEFIVKDPTPAPTVQDCLLHLDNAGWSELIDPRWRRQIEQDLRKEFGPALSEEVHRKAVSVVLSPDEELPEAEYEFLPDLPDTPAKRLMLEDLM